MFKVNHATSNGFFVAAGVSFLGFAAALFSGEDPSKKAPAEVPTATAPTRDLAALGEGILAGGCFGLLPAAVVTRVLEDKHTRREVALIKGLSGDRDRE